MSSAPSTNHYAQSANDKTPMIFEAVSVSVNANDENAPSSSTNHVMQPVPVINSDNAPSNFPPNNIISDEDAMKTKRRRRRRRRVLMVAGGVGGFIVGAVLLGGAGAVVGAAGAAIGTRVMAKRRERIKDGNAGRNPTATANSGNLKEFPSATAY